MNRTKKIIAVVLIGLSLAAAAGAAAATEGGPAHVAATHYWG